MQFMQSYYYHVSQIEDICKLWIWLWTVLWYELRTPHTKHHVKFLCIINLDNSIWHAINMRINRVENARQHRNSVSVSMHQECVSDISNMFVESLRIWNYYYCISLLFFGEWNKWESICFGSRIICIDWVFRFWISNSLIEQTFDFLSNAGTYQIMNWATRKVFCLLVHSFRLKSSQFSSDSF